MRKVFKHIDNTSLFIILALILSVSFAVAMIYRQHRMEESEAKENAPCWELKLVNGKVVNEKTGAPNCPDNPEDTPIGR